MNRFLFALATACLLSGCSSLFNGSDGISEDERAHLKAISASSLETAAATAQTNAKLEQILTAIQDQTRLLSRRTGATAEDVGGPFSGASPGSGFEGAQETEEEPLSSEPEQFDQRAESGDSEFIEDEDATVNVDDDAGLEALSGTEPAPDVSIEVAADQQVVGEDVSPSFPSYPVETDSGSGVVTPLGGEYALTAGHMGEGRARVFYRGAWRPCTIQRVGGRDMALVRVPGVAFPKARFRSARYRQAAYLYSNQRGQVFRGLVVNPSMSYDYDGKKEVSGVISVDPEYSGITPGDSGGPVFDKDGNLLGVISSFVDKEKRHVEYAPITVNDDGVGLAGPSAVDDGDYRPRGVLYVPKSGTNAKVQSYLSQIDSLPVRFEVVKVDSPPAESGVAGFPVVKYPSARSETGRAWGFGSAENFIANFRHSDPRPKVTVYTFEGCGPCERFKRDVAANEYGGLNVVFVHGDVREYPTSEFVGQDGQKKTVVGYGDSLKEQLKELQAFYAQGGADVGDSGSN